jgi:hypothetical protein
LNTRSKKNLSTLECCKIQIENKDDTRCCPINCATSGCLFLKNRKGSCSRTLPWHDPDELKRLIVRRYEKKFGTKKTKKDLIEFLF